MKISVIQLNSQDDKEHNIGVADRLIAEAVEQDHPDLVSLPEYFNFFDLDHEKMLKNAEEVPGKTYDFLKHTAKRHKIFLHGGSMPVRSGNKIKNTTFAFDPDGNELARYDKIHLADFHTPDGGTVFESESVSRGTSVVDYEMKDGIRIGCTICYDLRFSELFLSLQRHGARIIMTPSAFTLQTGKDHWEVVLRARAIETQCFIVAAAQIGPSCSGQAQCYGHAMIIDPWGHVLAQVPDKEGYASATIDFAFQDALRQRMPVLNHRVL